MKGKDTSRVSGEDDEISLRDLILNLQCWCKYLLAKWKLIVLAGVFGGIVGFFYAYFKEPVYIAETTFVLEEDSGRGALGQLSGLAGLAGISVNGGGGIFQGNNIIQLYKSRSMIEKALLSSNESPEEGGLLIERYFKINNLDSNRDELLSEFNAVDTESTPSRKRDSIISKVVNDINTNYLTVERPDNNLSLISVKVRSTDELFAKEFADQIVSTVNSFYVETKTKKSLDNILILQHKTDSLRDAMEGAVYRSVATIDATPNLNPTRQVLRTPAQLSQVNAEANKAMLSTLVQNLELSKIALQKEAPLIQIIDKPVFPLSKEVMGKRQGMIWGVVLLGFICVLFIVIRKVLSDIMNSNT